VPRMSNPRRRKGRKKDKKKKSVVSEKVCVCFFMDNKFYFKDGSIDFYGYFYETVINQTDASQYVPKKTRRTFSTPMTPHSPSLYRNQDKLRKIKEGQYRKMFLYDESNKHNPKYDYNPWYDQEDPPQTKTNNNAPFPFWFEEDSKHFGGNPSFETLKRQAFSKTFESDDGDHHSSHFECLMDPSRPLSRIQSIKLMQTIDKTIWNLQIVSSGELIHPPEPTALQQKEKGLEKEKETELDMMKYVVQTCEQTDDSIYTQAEFL